jgi:hypothetical protein
MKKILKHIMALLTIVPIILLCSCGSRSSLPKLNLEQYYESNVTVYTYNSTTAKKISLSKLTSSSPSSQNCDNFTQLTLTGDGSWLYKMYIDTIYFYVYTTEATTEELVINFKLTNVVEESEFKSGSVNPTEFTCERSLKPTKNGSVLCTIPVHMTIADATSTSITIDILNSVNGTVADENGNESSFKWQIYGLEIYGESRSYS